MTSDVLLSLRSPFAGRALQLVDEAAGAPANCSAFCVDGALAAQPAFFDCTAECADDGAAVSWAANLPVIGAVVVLILFSGMFSGLTLGLLSLSIEGLDIVINGGSPEEAKWAARILPMRKRGNLLLCTLLLGNTLVLSLIHI